MPGDESTTYMVRHAKAGSRERWTAPDRDRPLTDAGRLQAAALINVIGRGVRRIKSSPYKRCMETVIPLAEALGLRVEEEIRLAEGAGPEWTLGELATAGGTVLCTHGDVMAEVITTLTDAKVQLQGGMQWAKGATWAFDITGGRIVAGRYLPPPI
jgi:phosphohistidine phosphatase SixA